MDHSFSTATIYPVYLFSSICADITPDMKVLLALLCPDQGKVDGDCICCHTLVVYDIYDT